MNEAFDVSHFRYFTVGFTLFDCDLMWLVYLRHDKKFKVESESKCIHNNKDVSELVPEDFHCIGMYYKRIKLYAPHFLCYET